MDHGMMPHPPQNTGGARWSRWSRDMARNAAPSPPIPCKGWGGGAEHVARGKVERFEVEQN